MILSWKTPLPHEGKQSLVTAAGHVRQSHAKKGVVGTVSHLECVSANTHFSFQSHEKD